MPILKLTGVLGLDTSDFRGKLDGATKAGDAFAKNLKGTFARYFSIYMLADFTRSLMQNASQIKDWSEQTGVSITNVQKLQVAAGRAGLGFEDMARALNKIRDSRKEAIEKGGDARAAFEKLGISVETLNDPLVTELDLLKQIGEALGSTSLSTKDLSILQDILGTKLVRVAAAMQQFKELGPIELMNEDEIEKIDRVTKRFEEAWRGIKVKAKKHVLIPLADRLFGEEESTIAEFKTLKKPEFGKLPEPTEIDWLWSDEGEKETLRRTKEQTEKEKDRSDALKESLKIQEQLFKIQLGLMSVDDRRRALLKEINAELDYAWELQAAGFEKEGMGAQGKAAALVGQLAGLKSPEYNLNLSQLQRLGAYAGPAAGQIRRDAHEQKVVKLLDDIKQGVNETVKKIGEGIY